MNTKQADRVRKSDLYQVAVLKGYGLKMPRILGDLLCIINHTSLKRVGFPETPEDDTVPTIPLLVALGYGTLHSTFIEWTLRLWPGKPVTDDDC
jgi:hypothetical protein